MNFEEEFPNELTLEYGESQIQLYCNAILEYLTTERLVMEPR